jgi:rhomboid protease GluP
LWGFAPLLSRLGRDLGFTQFMMWSCIVLYVVALALDPGRIGGGGILRLLSPSPESLFVLGSSGYVPVFLYGRWWTVLSAGWLHGSILHILFNILWIRQLAPATGEVYGASRMVIIYTVSSITGFLASSAAASFVFLPGFLRGAGFTVGASAAIFGLLGSIVYYGRRSGSRAAGEQARSYALMMFLLGFIIQGIDNWAHLGGFVGGYLCGRILDPLHPERLDHLIIALACLVLTAAAIAYSILTGLPVLSG